MATQPARGMRDFLPEDVRRREYDIVGVIRDVYDRYGFEPLETPAAENIETLLGKYGDEGNKLIFKILKRGEHESSGEADLALRYDLTVPLARVVAEYQAKLPKFFKRYQIQPVWRADRPARGRFREFYQCDIDSIGSTSPVVEAEQIAAVSEIFIALGFSDFQVLLNHRAILTGLLGIAGISSSQHETALVALDKFDKIGETGVAAEFDSRGIDLTASKRIIEILRDVFTTPMDGQSSPAASINASRLEALRAFLEPTDHADAVHQLAGIIQLTSSTPAAGHVFVDPRLARGISYYTGAVMEITVKDLAGSLGGGGRYDNLIGTFLGMEVPACGFSLGLERILVVMQERGMFPASVDQSSVDVVVAAIDEQAQAPAMEIAAELRKAGGLRVDLYPDIAKKMDKIFKYVDQRRARFIAVLGSNELADGTVSLRNVAAKTTEKVKRGDAAAWVKRTLR